MSLQIGGVWVVGHFQLWNTMEMQDRWNKPVYQGKILLEEPEEESQWNRWGEASREEEIDGTSYNILSV